MQMFKPISYINILIVFAPLGITAGFLDKSPTLVFNLNFLAIASLSRLNKRRLGRLSAVLGPVGGGLLYATFDNAPLLIVTIQNNAIRVIQSCILGSVLANLLLVIGWCFFIAGIRHSESNFSTSYASTTSSLMIVASSALVVPSALSEAQCRVDDDCEEALVRVSHSVSIALLVLFATYLHYRLRSHRALFMDPFDALSNRPMAELFWIGMAEAILLVGNLALTSLSAYFLVRTLDAASDTRFISDRMASFVLLPLATDGPSRLDAIVAAYQNKMPKAMDFAISRSMHVALFVTPVLVLFSWAIQSKSPMTLHFPTPETISIFLGTLLLAEVCRDGQSDYLEGAMCLVMFMILSFSF
ncbi:Ca2+ transporter [Ilyonectria destructans]|nr:Ca2+ transporter [Ilyonectria destructans]